MGDLTKIQRQTLTELGLYGPQGWCSAYDMARNMFGERYGIFGSRARTRLQTLKRLGLAENRAGLWRITPAGSTALEKASE